MKTIPLVSAVSFSLVCSLSSQQAPSAEAEAITFSEHVAPIIFNNCAVCHRPGQAGPFSLLNYRDARRRGTMIAEVTKSILMPPWNPVAGHGEFTDSLALEQSEIDTLQTWVATGMTEGDPEQTPPLPEFDDDWVLGEPDLVVTMDEGFEVPAGGPDIYRNFVVPLGLDEDAWITAIEVRPSSPTVLHHILFTMDTRQRARRLDGRDGHPGFTDAQAGGGGGSLGATIAGLGGWAVGGQPRHLPMGLAREVPAGSDLILGSHFHPSGKKEVEKTTLGLYLSDTPPDRTMATLQLPASYGFASGLDIPPGDDDYKISGSFTLPVAAEALTVGGHAHYIGKELRVNLTYPDGREESVFYIDNWAFNWQNRYRYQEPLDLPAGTEIEMVITYDNSSNNPSNPFDPPQRIRWGLQSTEEMGGITLLMVAKDERDSNQLRRAIRTSANQAMRGGSVQAGMASILISRLRMSDKNGDGKLDADELPAMYRQYMLLLDTNKDGVLDFKELERLTLRR